MTRYLNDPPDIDESSAHQAPQAIPESLHQRHLPMLEDAGLITYDRETGAIAPGPNYDEIEHLL